MGAIPLAGSGLLLAALAVLARAAPQPKPACQVTIGSSPSRACGYIDHSDACCIEPLATRSVVNSQRHQAAGPDLPPHTNITFVGIVNDALYLVSHDDGCGPDHECWEVSPAPMGLMVSSTVTWPTAGHPGQEAEVTISFLAGPKPYNVTMTTATVLRAGGLPGTNVLSGSNGSVDSADCKLLRASNPVLDIVGQDATMRLVPPLGPDNVPIAVPRSFPAVNVTLHSDQCLFSCKDFQVPPQCRRGKFNKTDLFLKKPFEDTLIIRNVTRLIPAEWSSPRDGSLLYHCARMFLGGCVVATPTVSARSSRPSVPAEVAVFASQSGWSAVFPTACLVVVPACIVALSMLVAYNFWKNDRPHLVALQPFIGEKAVETRPLPRPARSAASDGLGSPRRVLLLYSKPPASDTLAHRALTGAMRALGRLLSASAASGNVQVVDMYEDPLLLEDGAVLRASSFLGDEEAVVIVVLSATMAEALRSAKPLDLDPFHKFISSVILGLSHVPERVAGRVFTVSLDLHQHPNFLIGIPVNAVYVMPYHLTDLLNAVPGLCAEEAGQKQFQSDEQALRKYIKQYTQQKPETSIIVEV